jgi:sterol desaturase/sphingolipid hydroxylase (fatty acid hydroxylase superfamily)
LVELIEWLRIAPWWQAVLALVAENAVILLLAVAFGEWLTRRFPHQRVAHPPPPLRRIEVAIAASAVLTNTVTTLIGLALWREGIIEFRTDVGWRAFGDVLLLLLVMDAAMYVLHRVAHLPWVFCWLHRMHHDYDRPRPLTLFILNPVENLSFGALWLVVLWLFQPSWLGMSIYLVLNVAFGTVGHLGVEPFPASWQRWIVLRDIAGSTFHARHHQDLGCNFGFYTLIWDRMFGTLRKDYRETVGQLPDWVRAPSESKN